MTSALEIFKARPDLAEFGSNALLLFALQLRFGVEDVVSLASIVLTDDSKDQKCDLVYIDDDTRLAVIAQGYLAENEGKREARANKAADLSIAASWILGNDRPHDLGASLQSAAEALDDALRRREIDVIELWYSHNLPESTNVEAQLDRAAKTTRALHLGTR